MARIAKKASQDGTFTVYLESEAVAWGLTSSAADALMARLKRVSRPVRWIAYLHINIRDAFGRAGSHPSPPLLAEKAGST